MLVGAIMSRKPVTVGRDHTVLHVARVMREKEVGAVIVVDGRGRPIGICTDRDVTMRAFLQGGNPAAIPVDRIMTKPVVAVAEDTLIFDLLRLMARKGIRRAPVVDAQDQKVVGLVSVDDIILLLTTELANVAEVLGTSSRVLGKRSGEEE
ncbi:MAG TPA: CBS domain-containing protein [Planctomycetota bacterium]|nr:CBS domain-containing protein [Planctomycetota bacterium]